MSISQVTYQVSCSYILVYYVLTISVKLQHHVAPSQILDDIDFDYGDPIQTSKLTCTFILLTLTLSNTDSPILNKHEPVDAFPTLNRDNIKVKYHPSSGIVTSIHGFDTFEHHPTATSITPPDGHPWRPFKSRLEFDVAKLILEVGLNNKQTDHFIKLCHRCAIGKEKMSFRNHKDIHNLWEAASHCVAKVGHTNILKFMRPLTLFEVQFTKEVISVPYGGDGASWDYEIHYWDLWDLATDLLWNPWLFLHFLFDTHRFSKFDGTAFVHFIDEPFTVAPAHLGYTSM